MFMKILALALLLLMVTFAVVQWNDADGAFWAAVYALPAALMGIVLLKPSWLAQTAGRSLFAVLIAAFVVGTVVFWPDQPQFWTKDVWWEEETAREGLGMLIALLVSAVALPTVLRR